MRISVWIRSLCGLAVMASAALIPSHALAQDAPVLPGGLCVRGFSKVFEGRLDSAWTGASCIGPLAACRTAQSEASVAWGFKSNPSTCEPGIVPSTCDESRDLEGRIVGKLKMNVRANRPCPYRGAYEGSVEFTDATGTVVAKGRIQATLGVGTHQKPCVGPTCSRVPCETCYDVESALNSWTIGTEGIVDAPVTAGRYRGCRIRASLQGDYTTGVGPLTTPWRSKGNLDGVLECPCFGIDPVTPAE